MMNEIAEEFCVRYSRFLKKNPNVEKGVRSKVFINICVFLYIKYFDYLQLLDLTYIQDFKSTLSRTLWARRKAKEEKEEEEYAIMRALALEEDAKKREREFLTEIGMGDIQPGKEYNNKYLYA